MFLYKNTIEVSFLGFSAIFLCVAVGFYFLKIAAKGITGAGCWATSFVLGGIAFFFWSGILPLQMGQYFLIGEILHFQGFLLLGWGVYLFTGGKVKPASVLVTCGFTLAWGLSVFLFTIHPSAATGCLRVIRGLLFLFTGITVFIRGPKGKNAGKYLAGSGFILWGIYVVVYGFITVPVLLNFVFGFLVGLQILAAFGLIVMIVDRMRVQAEESEITVGKLKTLLPICSYCSNIRDERDNWLPIEDYIEARTESQFSHGICPSCLEKHFPQYADKVQKKK